MLLYNFPSLFSDIPTSLNGSVLLDGTVPDTPTNILLLPNQDTTQQQTNFIMTKNDWKGPTATCSNPQLATAESQVSILMFGN